jgi:mediator of RNA polymerase II transcription subunit 10
MPTPHKPRLDEYKPVTDTPHERISFLTLTNITPERYQQLVSDLPARNAGRILTLRVGKGYRVSQSETPRVVPTDTSFTKSQSDDSRLEEGSESTGITTTNDTSYRLETDDHRGEHDSLKAAEQDEQPSVSTNTGPATTSPDVQNQPLGSVSSGPHVSDQQSGQISTTASILPVRDPSPTPISNTGVLRSPPSAPSLPPLPAQVIPESISAPDPRNRLPQFAGPAVAAVRVHRSPRLRNRLDHGSSAPSDSDATHRRSNRAVKLGTPLVHRLTDNMAAVRDPNDVSGIIKDVVGDLYDMQSKTHGFIPETTDLLVDRIGELTEKLAHLKEQTDPTRAPNNPIHTVSIAPEIVDYVDDGRNPDIFTREFVENVQRGNAVINGKKQAFRDFSVILAQKMKEGLKGVDEGVDMVMRNAGLQDELAKAEKESRERQAKE